MAHSGGSMLFHPRTLIGLALPRVLPLALFLTASCSYAADSEKNQQALNMIAEFAERFCKSPKPGGETQEVELSGKAKAELTGMISKIASLGVEGAGKY